MYDVEKKCRPVPTILLNRMLPLISFRFVNADPIRDDLVLSHCKP